MNISTLYKKRLLYLILICSVVRMIAASAVELGNDEVYYYTYALHLQENYFDHPPGVALLIRLFTFNMAFQQELFIRLGSIVCAAIGTLLTFKIGSTIRNEHTGWLAAILYNTSVYSSIIAGTFIMPDSPQIVFWLASLLVLIHIIQSYNDKGYAPILKWVLFGVLSGACIMCKVHGVFLWFGLGLYIIFFRRKLLLDYGFHLAFFSTLIIISPIIHWDFQNGFAMWDYDSGRMAMHSFAIDKDSFVQIVLGQLFYNNPINVIITILAVVYLVKNAVFQKDIQWLLLFCGFPIIFTVTIMSVFNPVLPHWSGPGFVTLSLLAAVFLDIKLETKKQHVIPSVLKSSIAFTVLLITAAMVAINFYPGTIGSSDKKNYGERDFTLDMDGWKSFGTELNIWAKSQQKQNLLAPGLKIVCNKWFPAAHIEYYVAMQMHTVVVGVGNVRDLHQFVWLNHYRPSLKKGEDALCIVPSNYPDNTIETYKNSFSSVALLHSFNAYRDDKLTRHFNVYLLKNYQDNDEAASFKTGN